MTTAADDRVVIVLATSDHRMIFAAPPTDDGAVLVAAGGIRRSALAHRGDQPETHMLMARENRVERKRPILSGIALPIAVQQGWSSINHFLARILTCC